MNQLLGLRGEDAVVAHLKKEGFALVQRNYRVLQGEVDIIARKRELLVFVEVKTRAIKTAGLSEVVTPSKQRKIIFAAKHFLARHQQEESVHRFDVALVEGEDLHITYIANAFCETFL